LASAVLILCGVPALANDARVERMLRQLDPDARFEQVCDLEAMRRIGKDKTYRPERSIVGALETPRVVNSTMSGNGGAFKSKGQWYQFSFKCETTTDHMKVQAFSFQIGEPIPPEKWEPHGLW
jgi:hypothetical protein